MSSRVTTQEAPSRGDADEALDFVHRLCRGLGARPTVDRLCRGLVLDFPSRFRAGAGLVAELRDDAGIHVVGQFGYPVAKVFPDPFPMGEDWPLVRALREPDPLVFATSEAVAAAFPLMLARYGLPRPFAATQIASNGAAVGMATLSFDAPLDDVESVRALMRLVRDVVGLYAGLGWGQAVDMASSSRVGRRSSDEPLTSRQLTILHLLAEGMGNGAIAFRIGYSESTVRQESMAIYRMLGVSDRRAAVEAARTRGLLLQADDTLA